MADLASSLHPFLQTLQDQSAQSLVQALKPQTVTDRVAVLLFLLSAFGYLSRGRVWDKPDPYHNVWFERPQQEGGNTSHKRTETSRDVSQRLEEGKYQCVIFWGSQSGTSERFAEALGRECSSRFGINALVADLSDFEPESISSISQNHFAIFLLSTYGEGDPSDNTTGLWDWIKSIKDNEKSLSNLRYLAFGLGNSNYKYYNRVLDVVADALDATGATALIPRGRADDATGGTEEDFQAWKDDVFALFRKMGYAERPIKYEPSIEVSFTTGEEPHESTTSVTHQKSNLNSSIASLPIRNARELFTAGDRNCIHLELDLGHHELGYKTGDHIGIWPTNPDQEVNRLFEVLGLTARRQETVKITALDGSCKNKLPPLTTLEAAFRHHLEICAPVPRKTFVDIAEFAASPDVKSKLLYYGQDRDRYAQLAASTHLNFARLLQLVGPGHVWNSLPLSFVLDTLLPLQPRYYSISSSSVISPRRIAVTALVVNHNLSPESVIHGLASNYLLSATKLPNNASGPSPSYSLQESPESEGGRLYAHVRKSKFKLPLTSSTPLVLISAGTGFAPFRAFIAERAKLHALGKPVGHMLVFFGCRSAESDYIYRDELEKFQTQLGDRLEIVTAFSRDGNKKVYVQDRVAENSTRVLEMLDAGANMYICGKASMAREVDRKLEDAKVASGSGESEVKAWTDALKKRGKWKADVWG
ncbi:cytochrome P450 reductase 2 [Aaosphaeria arxii CBS 175.79]|uniref:NADPH--cytochrome P450 reductase n=1 Tax=Aaosphaeria arxii CBS 175.79 TaxID=1450172 RepID=A0A6A5XRE7_9PLEO|nr:cytochrome P450 reductase 2 [Aaosphaeria arxii CBS 175.79]KAF2014874.1 cytochrome P450 reductase 2 [Aaosphaeria arxii CBS 175.79]